MSLVTKVRAIAQANHEGAARCPRVGNVVADFCDQQKEVPSPRGGYSLPPGRKH